jgi:hypothetical protein
MVDNIPFSPFPNLFKSKKNKSAKKAKKTMKKTSKKTKKKAAKKAVKKVVKTKTPEEKEFDAFLKKIKVAGVTVHKSTKAELERKRAWLSYTPAYAEPYISVVWSTGGVSGGSCWDTGDDVYNAYVNDEVEYDSEFVDLDCVLNAAAADITFIRYKSLCRKLIKHSSWTSNEYYGNSTNYSSKVILLKELFDWLKENKLM